MPTLSPFKRREKKHQAHVNRPVIITGNFDLSYEDVVHRNRLVIIAFIASGLLAVAAFMPAAVYRSTADSQRIILQAEDGTVTNPLKVTIIKGDPGSGDDGYIEFGK